MNKTLKDVKSNFINNYSKVSKKIDIASTYKNSKVQNYRKEIIKKVNQNIIPSKKFFDYLLE